MTSCWRASNAATYSARRSRAASRPSVSATMTKRRSRSSTRRTTASGRDRRRKPGAQAPLAGLSQPIGPPPPAAILGRAGQQAPHLQPRQGRIDSAGLSLKIPTGLDLEQLADVVARLVLGRGQEQQQGVEGRQMHTQRIVRGVRLNQGLVIDRAANAEEVDQGRSRGDDGRRRQRHGEGMGRLKAKPVTIGASAPPSEAAEFCTAPTDAHSRAGAAATASAQIAAPARLAARTARRRDAQAIASGADRRPRAARPVKAAPPPGRPTIGSLAADDAATAPRPRRRSQSPAAGEAADHEPEQVGDRRRPAGLRHG